VRRPFENSKQKIYHGTELGNAGMFFFSSEKMVDTVGNSILTLNCVVLVGGTET
jgi:hypothetical protein